jgi:hypothetical protein
LTLDDGTDNRLSLNVVKKVPFYAALNPKRVQISFTPQRKLGITPDYKTIKQKSMFDPYPKR